MILEVADLWVNQKKTSGQLHNHQISNGETPWKEYQENRKLAELAPERSPLFSINWLSSANKNYLNSFTAWDGPLA